jgi:response regulator of citrate/malate metabolism
VLITDYYLGDLTGLELVDEIRRLIPSVEVVVATGNHDNRALTERAANGDICLLIKPVRFSDLSACIEARLHRDTAQTDDLRLGRADN